MPENQRIEKPLTCPACFAREIDPVMLKFDPEDGGEFYCIHCGYTARSRQEVKTYLDDLVRHRFGIDGNNSP